MQQFKLLPGLATAYAIRFALNHVMSLYQEAQKRISAGDLSILPEVWFARNVFFCDKIE